MYQNLAENYRAYAETNGNGGGLHMACDGNTLTLRKYIVPVTAVTGHSRDDVESYFEAYGCGFGNGKSDGDGGEITRRGGRGIDIKIPGMVIDSLL